jgi:arylsulfatase
MKDAYLMPWITFRGADFLETFVTYPPSQESASFAIGQVARDVDEKIKAMTKTPAGG